MSEYKKVKLGDIFTLEKGSLQSSKCTPGQYNFITAAEDWKTHESYTHDCEAIVYAVAASGSLGRAHYVNGKFIASDLCFIMQEKDKEKYPVNFQFYQIIFEVLRDEIVSKTKTGTSKESISQKNLSKYEIPYFDYDFQIANYERLVRTKQIIAEISKETDSQKAYAKQLRQNILQDAIEGKLTAEWRKTHPVIKGNPDFDAEALFEEIQKGKAFPSLQPAKQSSATPSAGSNAARNARSKELTPITDDEKPFEIPDGWKWVRLGEIINDFPRNGYSPKSVDFETDTKTLKLGAVTYGIFNPNEYKYIDETIPADSNYWLKNGDILIERSNSFEYVGICAIYTGKDNEFIYPDLLIKFRVNELISNELIHKILIAPYNRQYFMSKAKGAQKTMPKINQETVVNTLIPLVSIEEQKKIIFILNQKLNSVELIKQQISQREEYANQLMQSILKDEFEEK